jgi:protein TonB
MDSMPRLDISSFGIAGVQLNSPLEFGRFDGAIPLGALNEDGDIFPIFRVEPAYPTVARIRRINGWVDLEYTVTAQGSVTDIVVIKSEPLSTFDASAVAALSKWRFRPRVLDGRPVPTRVEQRIHFNVLNH